MAATDRRRAARGVAVAFVAAAACASSAQRPVAAADLPPDLTLTGVDGRTVRLDSFRGKVVLLDVWATWCVPCEASLPFYAELYDQHRSEGFEVAAVSVDEDAEALQDYLQRTPVPFQVFRDAEGRLPKRLGVKTMPTAFLIGRDGRTAWVHEGFVTADEPRIRSKVRQALAAAQP